MGLKKPYPHEAAPISIPRKLAKLSPEIRTPIPSFFGPPKWNSNSEVFIKILRFYKPPPALVLDATWGAGTFWRKEQGTLYDKVANYTVVGLDIMRRKDQTILGDLTILPFKPNTFDVAVYDPPFGGGTQDGIPELNDFYNWQQQDQSFGFGLSLKDLSILTRKFNEEIRRVLKPEALLITKCQDQARVFVHDLMEEWLTWFKLVDLIIFSAYDHKIMPHAQEEKCRQSVKVHSYFQVWERK
jgi:SAM-dependent methyltransferase